MHHANVSPCALDIDVGYQEVISQSDRQQEQLVNAFWYSTPEQGHPVVLAASADPPCGLSLLKPNQGDDSTWTALRFPSSPFHRECFGRVRALLATKGFSTRAFSLGTKAWDRILVRSQEVAIASNLLLDAGFAVPWKDVADKNQGIGEGAWLRVQEDTGHCGEITEAMCSGAHLLRLEASLRCRRIYVEVCSRAMRGALLEASNAGEVDAKSSRPTISLAKAAEIHDEVPGTRSKLSDACTVALELCDNPEKLCGYWLFANSGLFALVLGPRLCAATRYRGPVGEAADVELRSLSCAVLGKVERPGFLKVLRGGQEAIDSPLHDASTSRRTIEVDEEDQIVAHRFGGSELRWRILKMEENPFEGVPDAVLPVDSKDVRAQAENKSPGRERSRSPRVTKFEDEVKEKAETPKSKSSKVKEKARKADKDKAKDKVKEKDNEKDRDQDKKKARQAQKHCGPHVKNERREKEGKTGDWDVERDRERQKARDRIKDATRERERGRDRERDRDKEKRKEAPRSSREREEKPKRHLERSHAFDKQNMIPSQPKAQNTPLSLPSAAALLAAMKQAPIEPNPEVEMFLSMNTVESHAATKLRSLPRNLQRQVLDRGSLMGARDPSAVLISRVRDAMMSSAHTTPSLPLVTMMLPNGQQVHPAVEALIIRYGLDAQCAQQLRQLPLPLQAVAAELPVHEARNPSAFVMAQLQLPRFKQAAKAMQMQKPM